MSRDLGAPAAICTAPPIAYRRRDVYHSAYSNEPGADGDSYRTYKFLGRYPLNEGDTAAVVTAAARTQYGKRAKVFPTARWWVIYRVD